MRGNASRVLPYVVLPPILLLTAFFLPAVAQPLSISRAALTGVPSGEVIVGIASFYDEAGPTASGEPYDPMAFTAAVLTELRDKLGGIKFGKDYQPAYALAEYRGKRAILKFNDVGPLKPGRKFDLSRAAMEHFGGIDAGVLPEFKIVLLPPGREFTPGPLVDVQVASVWTGRADDLTETLYASARNDAPTAADSEVAPAAGGKEEAPAIAEDGAPAIIVSALAITATFSCDLEVPDVSPSAAP